MITAARLQDIAAQLDGRSYITEIQVDDAMGELRFFYLCAAADDPAAIMAARTAALNAAMTAVPTVTITEDDGTTNTIRTWDIPNTDLRLTAAQKTALQTARTVIETVRPFVRVYYGLTPAQQQFVLAHSPWVAQVLAVLSGG